MVIGIIPVRGGSKGIPGKNIMDIGGKPLVVWTIEQALKSKLERIYISTDSDEIWDVCRNYDVELMRRTPELASDTATTEDVLRYHLPQMDGNVVMLLQATSPARNYHLIDNVLAYYSRFVFAGKYDAVFTAIRPNRHIWSTKGAYWTLPSNYMVDRKPRQLTDNYNTVLEHGSIYITSARNWQVRNRFGTRPLPFMTEEFESVELDTMHEVPMIDALVRKLQEDGYYD